MSKPSRDLDKQRSCDFIEPNQRLLICITRKTSGCFWFLVDNLSYKLDGLANLYEKSIESGYTKEYLVAEISKEDKVLHIGAGAYPLTDIILAKKQGVKQVVGIDNDPEAVRLANAVIRKKKLHENVTIEHADGLEYLVKDFDVIIVSSSSWPHIEILKHIFKTSKKQTKIIVRALDIAIQPIVECIKSQKDIVIVKKIRHHSFPFYSPFGWQTFLLLKK